MTTELRILFMEDSAEDAELEARLLRKGGLAFTMRRVATLPELAPALDEFQPHLVISDYSLPGTSGLEALTVVHRQRPEIPFIYVSGTIGEERAIETLRNGATDYVLKDRLGSLLSKVQRALRERVEREESRRLEQQLFQAQKMEAVGRLAGGVAHDFNNLLTVINGLSQMMIDRVAEGGREREDLEEVLRAGQRAAALTRQLLAFSRRQVAAPVVMSLNQAVEGMSRMLERLIGEDVELATRLAPDLGHVLADPGQIEQVVMNLAVNARDAMPLGGRLSIETANAEGTAGRRVRLTVTDTGQGMDAETLKHIFEPFFTTKPEGQGTGLGLSTVYGIVKQGGGTIEVESEPGNGASFRIELPRVEGVAVGPSQRAEPGTARGTEVVLVVEDSPAVRRLAVEVLKSRGYTLLQAADGEEARELLKARPGAVHLVLTDSVMPKMGGEELARHVALISPSTKILCMTGYARDGEVPTPLPLLAKPFTPDELARKVREVLDG